MLPSLKNLFKKKVVYVCADCSTPFPSKGCRYFYLTINYDDIKIKEEIFGTYTFESKMTALGNFFRTEEEALQVAEKIRRILKP